MKPEIVRVGVVLTLLAGTTSGCGLPGEKQKPNAVLPKATAVAISTPLPTRTLKFLNEDNALKTGEDPILILYRSSAPENEVDRFEAEVELRKLFTTDFLTPENLGGNLELESVPSLEAQSEKGLRMRQWRAKDGPNSRINATVEATFGSFGLETIKIEGRVKGEFPSKDDRAVIVKSGEAEKVVTALEQVFALAGRKEKVHIFPGRHLPGSDEVIDVVVGVSGEEEIVGGRSSLLWVSPNGGFKYSIYPRNPR